MNMGLIIRKAKIDDTEQLIELRKALLSGGETHYSANTEEDNIAWQEAYKEWIKENISSENIAIFVGEYGKNNDICACVIGVIDFRAPMVGALNGKVGWAQSLVVDQSKRGLGVGEAMVEHLHNWFKNNQVNKVVIQSSKMAEDFNRKRGYLETGEKLLVIEFK